MNPQPLPQIGSNPVTSIGDKIKSQYPAYANIPSDILGSKVLEKFPAMNPYNNAVTGLTAANQAQNLQQGSVGLEESQFKLKQLQADPYGAKATAARNAADVVSKNSTQDYLNAKKVYGFNQSLVPYAQQIMTLLDSRDSMTPEAYQKALNAAGANMNQAVADATKSGTFTPKDVADVRNVTPVVQTPKIEPNLWQKTFGGAIPQAQPQVVDDPVTLRKKMTTLLNSYGPQSATQSATSQGKVSPSAPTAQTAQKKDGGIVVNNLPLIGGVMGGLLASPLDVTGPPGMALDAAAAGAGGALGEKLRQIVMGEKNNTKDIAKEGVINGVAGGLAKPLEAVGGLAVKGASKLPVVGPLVDYLAQAGDRALSRIFGSATGASDVAAQDTLKGIIKDYGVNKGSPANPAILSDRMAAAKADIGKQFSPILKQMTENGGGTTYGEMRQMIEANAGKGTPAGQQLQRDLDNIVRKKVSEPVQGGIGDYNSPMGATKAKARAQGATKAIPDNQPLTPQVVQDIKVQFANNAKNSYGEMGSPVNQAYKAIAKNANDMLRSWDNTGAYSALNQKYAVATDSLDALKGHVQANGAIPNQGRTVRIKGLIPLSTKNVGAQQAVSQMMGALPRISGMLGGQGVVQSTKKNFLPSIESGQSAGLR